MRKRAFWNSSRFPLTLIGALMVVLAIAGCGAGGGGGGGNNNPPPGGNPNPTRAIVAGVVLDNTSGQGVSGATVTIVGAGLSTQTATDGSFEITNVPTNATQFTVTSPDTATYPNIVVYQSAQYNTGNSACRLPLPTLTAGQRSTLPGAVTMYNIGPSGGPPPPPVVIGCN